MSQDGILELLKHSKIPLSAEEIFLELKKADKSVHKRTVFRSLEKLFKRQRVDFIITRRDGNYGKKILRKYFLDEHTHEPPTIKMKGLSKDSKEVNIKIKGQKRIIIKMKKGGMI